MEGPLVILSVLIRPLRWAVRRVGETNVLFLALLLLAVGNTALGVADRVRGVDAVLALTLAGLGLLAGWLISLMPLSAGWASLLAGLLGMGVALLRVGRLGEELLAVCRAGDQLVEEGVRWLMGGAVPAWQPVWEALAHLGEGAGTLLTRVSAWGAALISGDPGFDPAAVSLGWGLGLWATSSLAGWVIRRRERPLWALTPSGVLLLTAFSHVWGSHIYLLGVLLAGFLLLGLTSYERRMRRWQATNVDYPELRPQTIAVTGFLSLALVAAAQILPSLPLERIIDPAPVIKRERSDEGKDLAASLGMEQRQRTVFQEVQTTGLPRRHLLEGGPELSRRVVMVLSTEDRPVASGIAGEGGPPRYYWRSHTYDRYIGSGWAAGATQAVAYGAGVPAITATLETQRVVRQEVRWFGERDGLAHAAGTLMVADHDYTVAWRSPGDPFAVTIRATSYRADSFVPVASEAGLRADSDSYPGWVRERYLALPEEVPARVLALGRDLTATAATPYDRARAIEIYLRGFPYTLDVSLPPGGRDVVDYFLFDLKKGYCDYYASAMVVLARAGGLPARLAVGYATGTYDAGEARYVVTEADAHAWPEIYFPGYGWVRFEPTAGLRRLEHAAEAEADLTGPEGELEPATGGWWRRLRWTWWRVGLGGALLAGLVGVAWHVVEWWKMRRREPAAALAALYGRLRRSGRRLGVPMTAGDTPREFGVAFGGWLSGGWSEGRGDQAEHKGWGRLAGLVATGAEEIVWLTGVYGRASYSPRRADAADRAGALSVWGRLRWRLWLARVACMLGWWIGTRGDRMGVGFWGRGEAEAPTTRGWKG